MQEQLALCAQDKTFYLGYSGGLDSHVLLHILRQLGVNLQAVYIDHGLSPQAKHWQNHCAEVCRQLGVAFQAHSVDARAGKGESPEAAARIARYQVFSRLLAAGDYLLTAHHQDDQAETLLLQMCRGAGNKGLACMPVLKPFANGYHLRPLLASTRDELVAYARAENLVWIEDESNSSIQFDRNFLRHQIIPLLKERWPAMVANLARVASHNAEADRVQTWFALRELASLAGSQPHTIAIKKLKNYPHIIQKLLLRNWFAQNHWALPSQGQLERILNDVVYSRPDANPSFSWQGQQLKRYRDDLYLVKALSIDTRELKIVWDVKADLCLPHSLGHLRARLVQGLGLDPEQLQGKTASIRFRQGGERCQPVGRIGSHPLKKLLQEWQVPPWQRELIPLLYLDEHLAMVIGFCVCLPFAKDEPNAMSIQIDWLGS